MPDGRQRFDRACRDRIDPDAVFAKIFGEVFHRCLKPGFGDAHHVVMRHDFFGAVIGQRQQASRLRSSSRAARWQTAVKE